MRFVDGRDVSKEMRDPKAPPKVLCLGLPRCATSSCQVALEQLGYKPCMHMAEVAPYAWKLEIVKEAMTLMYPDKFEKEKARRQALLHQIFDGWEATADFPGCFFPEDLMEMYPKAKVILNTRDPVSWSRSIKGTLGIFGTMKYHIPTYLWQTDRLHFKIHGIWHDLSPILYNVPKEDPMNPACVDAHAKRVHNAAKKLGGREVIEFKAQQGWKPICDLVGKPVPEGPFPHANDEATVKFIIRFLIFRGAASWALLLSSPFLIYHFGVKKGLAFRTLAWFRNLF